ncbi:MAG: amidohydrolase family protein, partial [Chloroflexi bacterium]|nr:amidohydrolase family protein [Chloroflexota bacterium]
HGITSVSDAGGYWTRGHHLVWQRALDEGKLSVRANNALYLFPDYDFDEQLIQFQQLYTNEPDSLLRFSQAKIYIDGILSQGTSALLTPYNQSLEIPGVPDDGFLYFEPPILNQYVRELDDMGFQLHFHVTGDRGARIALDAIETAVNNNSNDKRHRLTHLYLIDQADRSRFNQLNVIADFQYSPTSTDSEYIDFMTPYIGKRTNELLPLFDMVKRGSVVTLSSDWDADALSPFEKIESVLMLDTDESLTLPDIIRMMTLDVAYLLHQDETTGSIEVGKFADLIVVDQNLFEISLQQMNQTQVLLTLLAGKEVYRHPSA